MLAGNLGRRRQRAGPSLPAVSSAVRRGTKEQDFWQPRARLAGSFPSQMTEAERR
jgi:hypothetical protein